MKKRKIIFNHFVIDILVIPDDGKSYTLSCCGDEVKMGADMQALCCEGEREKPFALVFRRGWTAETVAHECWHLFFKILRCMGYYEDHYVTFGELEGEIYAYRFSDLFCLVMDKLEGL